MLREARASDEKLILGLIHLRPMPGTPFYQEGDYEVSIKKAVRDAKALESGGASGCLIRTVDKAYPTGDNSDYVRTACLPIIASEVKKVVGPDFKIGVQLMWDYITPPLTIAKSVQADFTRCIAPVDQTASLFDGAIDTGPLKVLGYRKKIDAESVSLLAGIAGYHFHGGCDKEAPLSCVASAVMMQADAAEIMSKDEEINNRMKQDIRGAYPDLPIVLGGGTDMVSTRSRLRNAGDVPVGRCLEGENWEEGTDKGIIVAYMKEAWSIQTFMRSQYRDVTPGAAVSGNYEAQELQPTGTSAQQHV